MSGKWTRPVSVDSMLWTILMICSGFSTVHGADNAIGELEEILTTFRDITIMIAIIVIYLGLCRVALSMIVTAPEWLQVLLIVVLSALAYQGYSIIDSVVASSKTARLR